jgi:hypothetical protein
MQAVETQSLILYHTDLRGEWPGALARAFSARLPYARRLAVSGPGESSRASLAGIALAVRALSDLLARRVAPSEIVFAPGEKPRLAPAGDGGAPPDFSISHSGPWVGCAALTDGRVGFDLEWGTSARLRDWVVREAALKASGEGVGALHAVRALEWPDGVAQWRGEPWQVMPVEVFPGAAACVVSNCAARTLGTQALALAELFAP